jgi:cyclin T
MICLFCYMAGTKMSFPRNFRSQVGTANDDYRSCFSGSNFSNNRNQGRNNYNNRSHSNINDYLGKVWQPNDNFYNVKPHNSIHVNPNGAGAPSLKRRRFSASTWGGSGRHYVLPVMYDTAPSTSIMQSLLPQDPMWRPLRLLAVNVTAHY